MKVIEGSIVASSQKARIAIVAARFNDFVVARLVEGCEDALLRHGVLGENITLYKVPGAFEIPVVAQKLSKTGAYDSVICLGAVIRGSTSHYDYVCNEVSKGIAQVALTTGVPIMFGVLTCENLEQAIERSGSKAGNKGADCAVGALEMINLLRQI